jgi:hypothetical protein
MPQKDHKDIDGDEDLENKNVLISKVIYYMMKI